MNNNKKAELYKELKKTNNEIEKFIIKTEEKIEKEKRVEKDEQEKKKK